MTDNWLNKAPNSKHKYLHDKEMVILQLDRTPMTQLPDLKDLDHDFHDPVPFYCKAVKLVVIPVTAKSINPII